MNWMMFSLGRNKGRSRELLMNPDLEKLMQSFDRATLGMSPAQLQWLPAELREQNKWCVAQILEHLSLTYSGTAGLMRKVVASGAGMATTPSLRQRLGALMVVDLLHS